MAKRTRKSVTNVPPPRTEVPGVPTPKPVQAYAIEDSAYDECVHYTTPDGKTQDFPYKHLSPAELAALRNGDIEAAGLIASMWAARMELAAAEDAV